MYHWLPSQWRVQTHYNPIYFLQKQNMWLWVQLSGEVRLGVRQRFGRECTKIKEQNIEKICFRCTCQSPVHHVHKDTELLKIKNEWENAHNELKLTDKHRYTLSSTLRHLRVSGASSDGSLPSGDSTTGPSHRGLPTIPPAIPPFYRDNQRTDMSSHPTGRFREATRKENYVTGKLKYKYATLK